MDVFVSAADDDAEVAGRVAAALRRRGLTVWLTTAPATESDRTRSDSALARARAVVAVIGHTSTPAVRHERATAVQLADFDPSRRLISLVVGGEEAPGVLGRYRSITVDPRHVDVDALADALVAALRRPDQGRRDLTVDEREDILRRLDEVVARVGGTAR